MLNETTIKALEEKGFNRWQKGNYDRLYINATTLGLDCSYYKTGNISGATWCDEHISNSMAYRLKAAKTYIDVKTGKLHSDHEWLKEKAEEIMNEVEEMAS